MKNAVGEVILGAIAIAVLAIWVVGYIVGAKSLKKDNFRGTYAGVCGESQMLTETLGKVDQTTLSGSVAGEMDQRQSVGGACNG